MIGDFIHNITGGNIYLVLLLVFLIFYFDAMVLTIFPEFLILFFFPARPEEFSLIIWVILLVAMATIGDVSGNYTVYLLFKKWKWFHKRVSEKLRKYVNFLVLKDEKLILLNRVAPALPMCGAFMAACNWNVKASLFYIFLGGLIKYLIIVASFAFLDWVFPTDTAFWIMLIFLAVFLVISYFLGRKERRRLIEEGKEKNAPET
jgi:hypothetical protein